MVNYPDFRGAALRERKTIKKNIKNIKKDQLKGRLFHYMPFVLGVVLRWVH